MKVAIKELNETLAFPRGLVYRKYVRKGKLGEPIQPEDLGKDSSKVRWEPDHAQDSWVSKGESVEYFGRVYVYRSKYYLCKP